MSGKCKFIYTVMSIHIVLLSLVLWQSQSVAQQNDKQHEELPPLVITPVHSDGIYKLGETIKWQVEPRNQEYNPSQSYTWTIKLNEKTIIKQGALDLSAGSTTIETSLDASGHAFLEIRPASTSTNTSTHGDDANCILAGTIVAPEQLQPSAKRLDDFDEFWSDQIARLQQIQPNPKLE
jgi:cephalosporin-C deacetylase